MESQKCTFSLREEELEAARKHKKKTSCKGQEAILIGICMNYLPKKNMQIMRNFGRGNSHPENIMLLELPCTHI